MKTIAKITPKENRIRRSLLPTSRRKLWLQESQQVYVVRLFWFMDKPIIKETIDYPLND